MPETTVYDLIVIGGGPAGYVAAIRAGAARQEGRLHRTGARRRHVPQLGLHSLEGAAEERELYVKMKKAEIYGLSVQGVSFDFAKVMERSRGVADQMAKGVEFLFRKHKIDYFIGRGQVTVPGMVEITAGEHKGSFFKTERVLLATGCKPRQLPGLPVDGERIMTSREGAGAPRQTARLGRHHRGGRDRCGVCLFSQRLWQQGDAHRGPAAGGAGGRRGGRPAAAPAASRSRASPSTPAPRLRTLRSAKIP